MDGIKDEKVLAMTKSIFKMVQIETASIYLRNSISQKQAKMEQDATEKVKKLDKIKEDIDKLEPSLKPYYEGTMPEMKAIDEAIKSIKDL